MVAYHVMSVERKEHTMNRKSRTRIPMPIVSAIAMALALFIGCSSDQSPVSSTAADGYNPNAPWNPPPGYEIVPGRPVPTLNEDYWESENGYETNPSQFSNISSVSVGRNGGTVTLGNHRYVIPAGALSRNTTMTMAYASLGAVAVDCGPSPLTFAVPVTLTLSYAGTSYEEDGMDPSELRIWYVAPDGSMELIGGSVNESARTVSAPVDHFSRYILG